MEGKWWREGWHEYHQSNCKECPKKETKETRVEASLRSLSPTPHSWLWRSWVHGGRSLRWAILANKPWLCWSRVPLLKPAYCLFLGSVFRLKQGQVQLLPHLVKIMGFFGVMQVSRCSQGPKLKGACVTGVLRSDFCSLLPPRHTILPTAFASMHTEVLSLAVIWSLLYSACKVPPWWPCRWEISLISTLPCCTQDSCTDLPVLFPGLVPPSAGQSHFSLLFSRCFLPWRSIFSCSLPYCGAETGVFICNFFCLSLSHSLCFSNHEPQNRQQPSTDVDIDFLQFHRSRRGSTGTSSVMHFWLEFSDILILDIPDL